MVRSVALALLVGLAFTTPSAPASPPPTTDSTVVAWGRSEDESAVIPQDSSPLENDALVYGTALVPGHSGQARSCDGQFDWLEVPDPLDGSLDFGLEVSFTIEFCMKTTVANDSETPSQFSIYQNYPNPFNPVSVIRFDLPYATHMRLTVCDMLGREVEHLVDSSMPEGRHQVTLDAHTLASRVYFYRMDAGCFPAIRKPVVVK
jgi:hypothetical protein